MYSCQPAVGLDCVMRVSLCAPVMSVPSSTKHGRRRAAAPRPGSRHNGCKPVAGTGCVCLLLACVLHGQRCGAVIGPGARNRRGPRPVDSRGLFDDMLPAVSCIRGCSSAEARVEGGCRVQRCSSAVTAATAAQFDVVGGQTRGQGGTRWDRETGRQTGSQGGGCCCSMPSRSGGALTP